MRFTYNEIVMNERTNTINFREQRNHLDIFRPFVRYSLQVACFNNFHDLKHSNGKKLGRWQQRHKSHEDAPFEQFSCLHLGFSLRLLMTLFVWDVRAELEYLMPFILMLWFLQHRFV